MAERDPFGRSPDENPLAGLGSLSDGSTGQAAEPVVVADWSGSEPTAPARPAPRQERPTAKEQVAQHMAAMSAAAGAAKPPKTGYPAVDQSLAEVIRQAEAMSGAKVVQSVQVVGRVVKLVVFLVVLGVLASVAYPLIDAGKDVRDAIGDLPSPQEITPPGSSGEEQGSSSPDTPPTGLRSNSMLTRRNFDRALDRLSTSGLGRLRTLAIRPERIDAQLLTKGGSLRSVQIRFDEPNINDFGASGGGFSHLETILFSKIDRGAPARLARSAAGRAKRPVSQVDYVTIHASQGQVTLGAYLKAGGGIYLANSRGRITRRIS